MNTVILKGLTAFANTCKGMQWAIHWG